MRAARDIEGRPVSEEGAGGPPRPGVPALSVVVVTPDGYEPIRRTLAFLRRQTICELIEVVLVAPETLRPPASELAPFWGWQLVDVGQLDASGAAIAAGFRCGRAPIVAYAEEHSFPEPAWAEALVRRHEGPWAAVGWSLRNANPGPVSWAHMLVDFGPWVAPVRAGEVTALAWHHTSYKRDALLPYRDLLESFIETEGLLHRQLVLDGARLYLEGSVASEHLNPSKLRSHLAAAYLGGRSFGSERAAWERWSRLRRALVALAAPLVLLVCSARLVRQVGRVARRHRVGVAALPALVAGLAAHTAGETVGYLGGSGRATQRRLSIELERHRHLSARDRERLGAGAIAKT